jgi:ABC-2 type transport system ATP-binding protein
MIDVKDLTRSYPGVLAVDRVSFSVGKGEVAGFLGPNGAGKTTTMRILTCFLAPSSGSASVAGFDVLKQSMEVRRRVGYLPESNPLYTEMRVDEYLSFRARIRAVPARERKAAVDAAIDRTGLGERRRSIIGHLSKGLRQRVGIADAILHRPQVVILDEPTIGLDPSQVREVRDLIRDLGKESTVLLSSHILSEVEKLCGRILIMNRGRLVEQGTPREIAQRVTKTGNVRLLVRGDGRAIHEALKEFPGVAHVLWEARGAEHEYSVRPKDGQDLRPGLHRCARDKGWELLELASERLSLEEIFTTLTAGPEEAGA